jgi:hypothetical protein
MLLLFSLLFAQLVAGSELETFRQFSSKRTLTATADLADTGSDYPNSSNIDFSSILIDSELLDILWCGDDPNNILVLSAKGTVYQTNDQGKTWNKLRETFQKTGKKEASGEENVIPFIDCVAKLLYLGRGCYSDAPKPCEFSADYFLGLSWDKLGNRGLRCDYQSN